MKILCLISLLMGVMVLPQVSTANPSIPDPIRFMDTFISINADHNLVYYRQTDLRKQEIVIDLPDKQTLRYVTLDNSNVVKTERYVDAWILMLETSRRNQPSEPPGRGCETTYGAVVVLDEGKVLFSGKSGSGTRCAPVIYGRDKFIALAKPYVTKRCETVVCESPSGSVVDPLTPDPIRFGKTFISVNSNHDVIFYTETNPRKQEIAIDLPHKETLHFVMRDFSNVVHAERVWDAWIVLLETSKRIKPSESPNLACETFHGAVIVRDDGKVFFNKSSGSSSGCPPISADRLAFEYLADPYVTKTKKGK